MNANKLADELDSFLKEQEQLPWGTKQVYLDQAADMLRQQQAEIEHLKELFGCDPAYFEPDNEYTPLTEADAPYQKEATKEVADTIDKAIGLKTLTDEEIETIFQKETGFTLDCDAKVDEVAMLDFARAILKKAQEK